VTEIGCLPSVTAAESIGLNAIRIFLHVFPWYANRTAFLHSYDHLLQECSRRNIKPLVVVFDDDFYDVPGVTNVTDIAPWLATKA